MKIQKYILSIALVNFSIFASAQVNTMESRTMTCAQRFELLAQRESRNIDISYEDYKKFGGGPMTYPIAFVGGLMVKGLVAISNANEKQYYKIMSDLYSDDLQRKMHGIGLLHTRFSQGEQDQNLPWIEFTEMMMKLSTTEIFCNERTGAGFTAEARKKLEKLGYQNEFELHMIGIAKRDPKAIKFAYDQENYEMITVKTVRNIEDTERIIREQMALYLKSK